MFPISDEQSPFAKLIHRAHRREMFWRACEFTGIGGAIGGAMAVALQVACAARSIDGLAPSIVTILAGAISGLIVSISVKRPNLLETAQRIDSQIASHDLLATALQLKQDESPSLQTAVFACANAAAAHVSLDGLVLQRFGFRAWGGLALGIACVLLASLLQPNRSTASEHPAPAIEAMITSTTSRAQTPDIANRSSYESSYQPTGRPESTAPLSGSANALAASRTQVEPSTPKKNESATSSTGVGDKHAESIASRENSRPNRPPEVQSIRHDDRESSDRIATATTGREEIASRQRSHAGANTGVAVTGRTDERVAASTVMGTTTGNAPREAMFITAAVPAEYRDLVREFFSCDR